MGEESQLAWYHHSSGAGATQWSENWGHGDCNFYVVFPRDA